MLRVFNNHGLQKNFSAHNTRFHCTVIKRLPSFRSSGSEDEDISPLLFCGSVVTFGIASSCTFLWPPSFSSRLRVEYFCTQR